MGRGGRFRAGALVALLAVTLGSLPAHAGQTDASTPPEVSGPILEGDTYCEAREVRAKRVGSLGSIEVCVFYYSLLPAETDPTNDFEVTWMQFEMMPAPGWCVSSTMTELDVPSDMKMVSATPTDDERTAKARAMTVSLAVDGGGKAPMPGEISQDITLMPGRLDTKLTRKQISLEWKGQSAEPVMLALGIQASRYVVPELVYNQGAGLGGSFVAC